MDGPQALHLGRAPHPLLAVILDSALKHCAAGHAAPPLQAQQGGVVGQAQLKQLAAGEQARLWVHSARQVHATQVVAGLHRDRRRPPPQPWLGNLVLGLQHHLHGTGAIGQQQVGALHLPHASRAPRCALLGSSSLWGSSWRLAAPPAPSGAVARDKGTPQAGIAWGVGEKVVVVVILRHLDKNK